MRAHALVLLFVAGCSDAVTGTVLYEDTLKACPTDRPIEVGDLDCLCGMSGTIVDTVLADTCVELWCDEVEMELTCTYGTDTGDSGS